MPLETRIAMRDAIALNPIIVGAYSDRDGGVCPMLAAHRNGGRTSFASFARAWDRYAGAGRSPRRASEREVRTLTVMLEASIEGEAARAGADLRAAIAEHRASRRRRSEQDDARGGPAAVRTRREAGDGDAGGRDRTRELEGRPGWAWLRPFRRLDEYERAIDELDRAVPRAEPLERAPLERAPA